MTEAIQLIATDAELYAILKETVRKGMAIFFVTGKALGEIRDREYYRADGYETFEEFIDAEYGWTKRYANQLILDAEVINQLPEDFRKLITSHAAARELAKVPEMFRIGVIDKATDGGKKPATGPGVKKSSPPPKKASFKPTSKSSPPPPPAKKSSPPKKPEFKDATGLAIPPEILSTWNKGFGADSPSDLWFYIRSVREILKKALADKNIVFVAEVDMNHCIANLQQVLDNLDRGIPHAVCPSCQGVAAKGCGTCKERGFVSQFYWKTFVPEETRNIRPKP